MALIIGSALSAGVEITDDDDPVAFCFRSISNSAWCDVCHGFRLCLSWGRRWSNLLWPVFAMKRTENNRIFLLFTLWEMNNCLKIRIWFNLDYSGKNAVWHPQILSTLATLAIQCSDLRPNCFEDAGLADQSAQCECCKPALEALTLAQLSIAESALSTLVRCLDGYHVS